eukprot:636253-Prymnesium_polylepis.1
MKGHALPWLVTRCCRSHDSEQYIATPQPPAHATAFMCVGRPRLYPYSHSRLWHRRFASFETRRPAASVLSSSSEASMSAHFE